MEAGLIEVAQVSRRKTASTRYRSDDAVGRGHTQTWRAAVPIIFP